MLQKHPFFSRPLIFFGTQQETESEEAIEEGSLLTPWCGPFINHPIPNNTALFFLWDEDPHEDEF